MLSNQSITIRRHSEKDNDDGHILTMLTWPAGASIPKIDERVVYYTEKDGQVDGVVRQVEHEHVLKERNDLIGATPEINITIWLELE